MHLDDGRAADGSAVLSPQSTKLMQTPQVECPAHELATHWGVGWMIRVVDGRVLIGHGGNTLGRSTYFHAVPDRSVAVALLTNASGRAEPSEALVRELLVEFAGVELPPRPAPSGEPIAHDPQRLAGTYVRHGARTTITSAGEQLTATIEMEGPMAQALGLDAPIEVTLHPVAGQEQVFVIQLPQYGEGWIPLRFYGDDGRGRPKYLHTGARVARRTA